MEPDAALSMESLLLVDRSDTESRSLDAVGVGTSSGPGTIVTWPSSHSASSAAVVVWQMTRSFSTSEDDNARLLSAAS